MDATNTTAELLELLASLSPTVRRALGAARLAISADSTSTEAEALTAGRTAGELAFRAGLSVDAMWVAFPGFRQASAAWSAFVDGWHDAAEARAAA